MWFDTHCHLHLCDDPPSEVVERARTAEVEGLVTLGTDVASSTQSVEIAEAEGVYAAAGVHPNSATEWDDASARSIGGLLTRDRVVAVGESGLDFYRDYAPRAKQEDAFAAHIELAKTHDKALVIHTRDSIDRAIEMLEAETPPARFVFHCWSGDAEQLRRALDLGAYISFAGNVSFKSATDIYAAAEIVPEDRILVETDSPYLAPVPHRGKPNEPAYVALVGATVAAARDIEPEDVGTMTTANAKALFAL